MYMYIYYCVYICIHTHINTHANHTKYLYVLKKSTHH